MTSASTTKARDLEILSDPSSWDQWYEDTRASVPQHLWEYFDPDSEAVMLRPIEPFRPVDEPPPEGAEPPQARNVCLSRNQRQEDLFYKDHASFSQNERKWDNAKEVEAKLRERILSTVATQKKASLRTIYSMRQWLTSLKATSALPLETIKQNIQTEYQKLMGIVVLDWPSGGPTNWRAKWEKLINQATRYTNHFAPG